MSMTKAKFEDLIARYELAIRCRDHRRLGTLTAEVEKAADAMGYMDHGRLLALHTAAEKASEPRSFTERDVELANMVIKQFATRLAGHADIHLGHDVDR